MNKIIVSFFLYLIVICNVTAVCIADIESSTHISQFVINNNGTVTDNKTGLTWMRCSLGQIWDGSGCTGSISRMNWQAALINAKSERFANFNDWRLPNIKELASIVESSCFDPAINIEVFPNTPGYIYWSSSARPSTSNSNDHYKAYLMYFNYGVVSFNSKSNREGVRLVRN